MWLHVSSEGSLLGVQTRDLTHVETLVHVLLLKTIDQLGHVADQLLVILAVLRHLFQHGVGGHGLLHCISIDV